ncbi:MAG: Smr/MutS family protein [Betaproteobacteria bacterium]|nr:Smr/MutS family protein [Betaproteobacteria bacterium]
MAKLTDLKELLAAARAKAAPATGSSAAPKATARPTGTRRAVAALKHADGDVDLARAFADVQRLPPANKAQVDRPRPSPVPHYTLADERDVLQASKYGDDPAPQSWDTGQEFEHEQTFVRRGLPADLAGKLRRGHWSVQAELDLHGLIVDEAHDALSDFIVDARTRRLRCVRVVHGKGLTSPGKEPVLKGKVRRWLAHWDEVLAYAEAPRHAGGGGALLVLLKGSQ